MLRAAVTRSLRRAVTSLKGAFQKASRTDKGTVLRKFALLTSACAVLLFASFASAQQQVDVLLSGATLKSFAPRNDSVTFHPLTENNGTYVGISGDFVGFKKRRLGLNFETAWRYHQATYYGYENYRPILTDVNAFFQPKLTKKVGLDFMAGIGVASNRFNLLTSCTIPGCVNYTSSNHFMEDLGVRYSLSLLAPPAPCLRPPRGALLPHPEQSGIRDDNVFRVGASIGYITGPD